MKQQVLVIHGANSFTHYEDYLQYLDKKSKRVELEDFTYKDWKKNLQETLGEKYQVIAPTMPNKQNARYREWKIWLDGFIDKIDEDAIYIGHSMGGIFLAKYLSERKQMYKALFLVAAPFAGNDTEDLCDFNVEDPAILSHLNTKNVILYHSKNDPVVPYEHSLHYKESIPHAKMVSFEDRYHFNQEMFPEIVQEILSL